MTNRKTPRPQRGGPRIRRLLTTLLSVLIVAAVLVAASPVDAAPRKVKLGISMTHGNRDTTVLSQEMDRFKAETGVQPAIWTLWSTWGNPATKDFPTEQVLAIKARNAVPLIFWEPAQTRLECTAHAKFRLIMRGRFDSYIRQWARAAKRSQTTILLRFAHEINGRYFPWTIGTCGNKIWHYKKAWKRIYNIVRNQVGARNVKFLWTVAKRPSNGGNQYKPFYVGNRYTQFVGYSAFNWGAGCSSCEGKWVSMMGAIKHTMRKFSEFTRKPVIIAELGSNAYGGPNGYKVDKPDWIRTGYVQAYRQYPNIVGIVWLNEDLTKDGHPDWSLDDPEPGSMDAYAWVLNYRQNGRTIFQGRFR